MDHEMNTLEDGIRNYDIRLNKFLKAVFDNDIEYVEKKLIKNMFHVDARDGDFVTPLLLASILGHLNMVKLLISLGARINEGNQIGITPVHAACANGHLKILHELIKAGGDMRPTDLGITPMGMACAYGQLEIVKYLLIGGMSLDTVPGSISPSPLMLAAINNQDKILIYFFLPNIYESQRLNSLPSDTRETLEKMMEESRRTPPINIDEIIPEFFNLNLLTLSVVTHNRSLFELLCELGANIKYKLCSGRNVSEVAEKYGFDIWQSFSDSMRSKNKDKSSTFTDSNCSIKSNTSATSPNTKKKIIKVKKLKRIGDFFSKFL